MKYTEWLEKVLVAENALCDLFDHKPETSDADEKEYFQNSTMILGITSVDLADEKKRIAVSGHLKGRSLVVGHALRSLAEKYDRVG